MYLEMYIHAYIWTYNFMLFNKRFAILMEYCCIVSLARIYVIIIYFIFTLNNTYTLDLTKICLIYNLKRDFKLEQQDIFTICVM